MKMKLPPFIELYRALIATPSISATDSALDQSNEALINLLAGWFADLGFRVEIQPVPDTRHKFNLLASIGENFVGKKSSGEGSGGLLLAGHTDTVPYDEGRWTRDPFTLTEHDNKLYGLGTADMKGFFAFILDAVRDIDASTLSKPLYILATADEETTMAGARYFAASTQLRPDFAIIGEPTSLQPVRAHKGHISNAIRITGQSGHSSDPARGVNAIDLMHESITELMKLRTTLQERYNNPAFAIPYPTMNFGHINGGDAANRICACCELHMDIRPLPGLTLSDLDELMTEALAPVSARWPGRLSIDQLHPPIPGYECPTDHHMVGVIEELLGERTAVVNYCTEAPFIQQICPTLVLGPGSINQAHQPDEFIDMAFIEPTRELIGQLVDHFCQQK
ncbi:acetylornithine deacetylase [Yersinia enterocolitica subsp. palearctica YE-P4]|uniref:Acetylornithine deacetylase n=3 Tax=Yersinia enterocolitica TaxID=630 RepID=A0A0H3NJV4_YERE1|nr:acetylornithine deacetylase [Yersinia enterocolitica subsp. palearctica PhRBD_Ye1]EKN4919150.1 acetylornithine deacetylase [Yersinia enterocolitica]EOR67206.1 acetylornithine deacetylase [Yersinia enterocolitica subsp. palearctica YE-149]EOR75093.1 acetylornithine deacetylase [Yersinia enterocolitica subsp. palearctica YE-150]EOR75712.1 acetylornithine deacetylase [Yersinia enterocolitica subsp. palearctica YE-P1]EOR79414.1 acetylornithine deacetylase [Yersinia enterocolitica subsp. palearc